MAKVLKLKCFLVFFILWGAAWGRCPPAALYCPRVGADTGIGSAAVTCPCASVGVGGVCAHAGGNKLKMSENSFEAGVNMLDNLDDSEEFELGEEFEQCQATKEYGILEKLFDEDKSVINEQLVQKSPESLNRYSDIMVYKKTQVLLKSEPGYINACFVNSPVGSES